MKFLKNIILSSLIVKTVKVDFNYYIKTKAP